MMEKTTRDSFIFYRSFQESIEEADAESQLRLYRAIAHYALNQEEPKLKGMERAVWHGIKPQLDANFKRYLNGKKEEPQGATLTPKNNTTMAITLNNTILPAIVANAHDAGLINTESSPTVAMYQISRYWRELFQTSTRHRSDNLPQWSEQEVSASNIIFSTILYLAMIGCRDVEQLLTDAIKKYYQEHSK